MSSRNASEKARDSFPAGYDCVRVLQAPLRLVHVGERPVGKQDDALGVWRRLEQRRGKLAALDLGHHLVERRCAARIAAGSGAVSLTAAADDPGFRAGDHLADDPPGRLPDCLIVLSVDPNFESLLLSII